MRNLMKLLLILAMTFALASCAKKEDSGSSTAASAVPPVVTDFYGSGDTEFGDFATLKNYYETKSFADSIPNDTVVFHVGPLFGASVNTVEVSFSAVLCIGDNNLFGDDDLCNSNSGLTDMYSEGKYKYVRSSTTSSNLYDLATGVDSNGVTIFSENQSYDLYSEIFRKMLNIDGKEVYKVIVSAAKISMTDNSDMSADHVEYFFKDGTYEAYVISKSLPLIANPVAALKGTFNVSGGINTQYVGKLNNMGSNKLINVTATVHRIRIDNNTQEIIIL